MISNVLLAAGHEVRVKNFVITEDVLHGKQIRIDENGNEAAVIKVQLPMPGVTFSGNLIGESQYFGSEYWVWLSVSSLYNRANELQISCPGQMIISVDFSKFGIPVLKAKGVYELEFDIPKSILQGNCETSVSSARYCTLKVDYYPLNSQVKIDGRSVGVTPLVITNLLGGQHTVEIASDGYFSHLQQITASHSDPICLSGELNKILSNDEALHAIITGKGKDNAIYALEALAEQGDTTAQCNLGSIYMSGIGVTKSYSSAIKWFRMAAEQECREALNALGQCYYNGLGCTKSYAEAVKLFRRSAVLGNADAQYHLGNCYYKGTGVEQSYEEAVRWFRMGANQDNAQAECRLADCYYLGEGVIQSYEEAVKWYRKSAEHSNPDAQFNLGVCYWHGTGVEQSKDEAVSLWRKAAKRNHDTANRLLTQFGYK